METGKGNTPLLDVISLPHNKNNKIEMLGKRLKKYQPFSVGFEDFPKANEIFGQTVFKSNLDNIEVFDQDDEKILELTSPILDGLQIVKSFRFSSNNYMPN